MNEMIEFIYETVGEFTFASECPFCHGAIFDDEPHVCEDE
jgi:hypothetical protein